jgi:hypothetical protein
MIWLVVVGITLPESSYTADHRQEAKLTERPALQALAYYRQQAAHAAAEPAALLP